MFNKNNSFECECGKVHNVRTENIDVGIFAFKNMVKSINESKYKKILIIGSNKAESLVEKLKNNLSADKEIEILLLNNIKPTIYNANNIEDKGQELVVAVGEEELISVAKYYSYSLNCIIFIFPIGNFTDYTFSKYSRLFDGVEFAFYETQEPSEIFVSLVNNTYNVLQSYYISSKFICLFENIVKEYVYEKQICIRLKEFLKNTLNDYLKIKPNDATDMNYKNIWTLVRLGQAMSFYGETKSFFGGDMAVTNFLQALTPKADFLKLNTISLKLIINSYSCFYANTLGEGDVNLNKHIMWISQLLKITPTETIKRLVDSFLLKPNDQIKKRFNNYYPYLKGVLRKCLSKMFMLQSSLNLNINILKEYNLNKDIIEKAYSNCPCLYSNPCSLHLIFSYGYLDKLL